MNPINAIFATQYAMGVKLKHQNPMSTGFLGFWFTEVAVFSLIGVILGQFIPLGPENFSHSKEFLWGVAIVIAFVTWLYFYRAKKGAKAWADYSSLSIGWKRFWAYMSILAIVGPCVAMAIILG